MNVKRILQSLTVMGGSLWATAAFAATGSVPNPVGEGETLTLSKIVTLVTDVINVFLGLALTITIAMIIWSGFKMATARENPKQFDAGKDSLKNAIIGLVVVLGVGIIVRTIGDFAVSPTSILR